MASSRWPGISSLPASQGLETFFPQPKQTFCFRCLLVLFHTRTVWIQVPRFQTAQVDRLSSPEPVLFTGQAGEAADVRKADRSRAAVRGGFFVGCCGRLWTWTWCFDVFCVCVSGGGCFHSFVGLAVGGGANLFVSILMVASAVFQKICWGFAVLLRLV